MSAAANRHKKAAKKLPAKPMKLSCIGCGSGSRLYQFNASAWFELEPVIRDQISDRPPLRAADFPVVVCFVCWCPE